MFLLGGNTKSRPEPSLESLSAFVWEELVFLSHNIKPPRFVGLVLFVSGRSHLGEEGGEEKTSFEAQHGDDTREASASPLLSEAWIGKTKWKPTPCLVTRKQTVSQAWIFHFLVIFPPQGSPFPLLKAHVPMESTMENSGHC